MRRLPLVVLCILFVGGPLKALAGEHEWTDHRNERFGVGLSYPADVFRFDRATTEGDGQLFKSSDGKARLLVGAFANTERLSPASYQRFAARYSYPGITVDYAPLGSTWTVLSGIRGDTMVYEKAMFSCGGELINSFAILYPVVERDFYDPIVERIEDSFRPGQEEC
jgi:hypothetical protein